MRTPTKSLIVGLGLMALPGLAFAQDGQVKIGLLSDLSGPFAGLSGPGSVIAMEMAVEDAGGMALGKPIEVLTADHQLKPDIGLATARDWYETKGVDAIFDIASSSVALAINAILPDVKKLAFFSSSASERLTEADCSPYGVAWTQDTYANQIGLAADLIKDGFDTWYYIGPDYAYGRSAGEGIKEAVEAAGGKMLGEIYHPLNGSDFSSYVLQAQSSGAKVIALASAGSDMTGLMKQAGEFGLLSSGRRFVRLNSVITDVHAIGLEVMQGVQMISPWFWNLDEKSREFGERFFKRHDAMPTAFQAGVYSAVTQYIKAVNAVGTDDPDKILEYLKGNKFEDMFARNAYLRPNNRMIHDMYLVQAKTPAESKEPWDYFNLVATIPGDEAYRPLAETSCPLMKK